MDVLYNHDKTNVVVMLLEDYLCVSTCWGRTKGNNKNGSLTYCLAVCLVDMLDDGVIVHNIYSNYTLVAEVK